MTEVQAIPQDQSWAVVLSQLLGECKLEADCPVSVKHIGPFSTEGDDE